MQLILDSRTLKLREIVPDGVKVTIYESFIDLGTYKINDMGTPNTILIKQKCEVPSGMERGDVPCHKRYNWYYNPATKQFVKVI